MPAKTILIKKYENRRLYDATNSRYINLEEVAALVQRGYDVRVVDAASGEDITRVILTQIIAEGAKTPNSSFPLDILRQMVVASGRASQESAIGYMKAMLDLYKSTYQAITPALNPFDFVQNASEPTSQRMNGSEDDLARGESEAHGSDNGELKRLKDRLAELEKQMASLSPRATRAKKARKRRSSSSKR